MIKKGYRVLPPKFPAMKELTLRATRLNNLIEENTYKTIEVHPTSNRKALQMPLRMESNPRNPKNAGTERRNRNASLGNSRNRRRNSNFNRNALHSEANRTIRR
jgi:predicted nuclease with RNAse H fold